MAEQVVVGGEYALNLANGAIGRVDGADLSVDELTALLRYGDQLAAGEIPDEETGAREELRRIAISRHDLVRSIYS
jgi:hypothetical protein